MARKGIILAGGSGTRLYPLTKAVSKQLMPLYDKPMVYYPLSTLMLAGIRDMLIIATAKDLPLFQAVLGDGSGIGLNISYVIQERPEGIAQAFILGQEFIGSDSVVLILGDNFFYGQSIGSRLQLVGDKNPGATVFGYSVSDPSGYGVMEFDENQKLCRICEKPSDPPSNIAVTGLYFYDNRVVEFAKQVEPSSRGELEITDINNRYLEEGLMAYEILGRGVAWMDTGTHDNLLDAANYIQTVERRQGLKIGCIEEIAWRMGFIDKNTLETLAKSLQNSSYGKYLYRILDGTYYLGKSKN